MMLNVDELPLHKDYINSQAFHRISDYIWQPHDNCPYVHSVISANPKIKIFSPGTIPATGSIIYVGVNHYVEDCFKRIPNDGKYIVIHRDNDRPFIQAYYDKKPPSVKHVYTVNCQLNLPDVTAIPIGMATLNHEQCISLINVIGQNVETSSKLIFCRLNTNAETADRINIINSLVGSSFSTVITKQIDGDSFFRHIKAHKLTMSLRGGGADCLRTWESMLLGSIPVVTDCIEMRHFDDLPMVFCPENIDEEWCVKQDISDKSTLRMRMSYWTNTILNMKKCIL